MKFLGLEIKRSKTPVFNVPAKKSWATIIREPFTGAWQRNCELVDLKETHFAVYRCVSVISQTIASVPFHVRRRESSGVWKPARQDNLDRILLRPNHFQNGLQFVENWLQSKLYSGNTYVLKIRDSNGFVVKLIVLDPRRVKPLVAPSGDIYYQLDTDKLVGEGIPQSGITVPSSEIVHDLMYPSHPLVGHSPLIACGYAVRNGLTIQRNSEAFFSNASQPGGILSAPGNISEETATALQQQFEEFTGDYAGAIAVVGDGLKFEQIGLSAQDSQLVEQLKFTADQICAAFGVPAYKLGIGTAPGSSIEAQALSFYNDCLAYHVEAMEHKFDEALELDQTKRDSFGIFWNQSQLFRMDTEARFKSYGEAIKSGWMAPNEARRSEDMDPVDGGDTPYLQQQNYSLKALNDRDKNNPLTVVPEVPVIQQVPSSDTSSAGDPDDSAAKIDPAIDGGSTIAEVSLNGAQVSSLLEIISLVANGQMPIETARLIIGSAFPSISDAQIDGMLDPLKTFKPAPLPGEEPLPQAPFEEDDQTTDEVQMALLELQQKFIEGLKDNG